MRGRSLAVLALAACNFRPGAAPQDATRDALQDAMRDAARDAGHDAPPSCTLLSTGSQSMAIPAVATPPAIDGDLGDWNTCFIDINGSNAQDIFGSPPYPTGRFAVEHDGNTLYVGAEVVGTLPLGNHGLTDIYLNNSIELYIDADGLSSTQSYDSHTAQLVIDHANRQQWFVTGNAMTLPPVTSAVGFGSDGKTYRVEVAIPASAFGSSQFASPFGFDIDFVGGDGTNQLTRLAWAQVCAGCSMDLCCDAREFGTATLPP